MKLAQALFEIVSGTDRFHVLFRPGYVVVKLKGRPDRRVENDDLRYKPCMTHCKDLIRLAVGKPPLSNQAAQRHNKDARPLAVFHG